MLLNTYEPWKFAFSKQTNFENLEEDSFGISAEIDKYSLKFEKFETNQPYRVKISYLPSLPVTDEVLLANL